MNHVCRRQVRRLTTDADNDALSLFQLIDIHYTLESQFFEVEAVSLIEIRGDGLRVIIDHDRPLAHIPKFTRTSDRTPVEFNTTPNAIHAASKDHRSVLVEFDVMLRRIVSGVKIIRVSRILRSECVDTFDERCDAK